jgi:uncharacterized protein YkwD
MFPRQSISHRGFILVSLAFLGCTGPSLRQASTTATPALLELEQNVYRLVNEYRVAHNLSRLTQDPVIIQQARKHSEAMANKAIPVSHSGFKERVREIGKKIPYRFIGENVAVNQGYENPADIALRGWLESPEHKNNIEGSFTLTGIGVAQDGAGAYYFTQIFVLTK